MSDAEALSATEQARALVADPRPWGIEPRPGLEPLDVHVKFNRAAAHTKSAYQVIVRMKLTLDEGQTHRTEAALVGEGRTKGEALEMFYAWMADENALLIFREVVKAHDAKQVDALAQAELDKQKTQRDAQAVGAKERLHEWFEKKFDFMGRKAGVIPDKIQK